MHPVVRLADCSRDIPWCMSLSRRQVLRVGMAGAAAVLVGTSGVSSARLPAPRWRGDDPFVLGVASGDPTPDGVVLWTRLAPDPLAPGGRGGMGWDPVTVEYEVAHDESFRQVVTRGTAVATRELAHACTRRSTAWSPLAGTSTGFVPARRSLRWAGPARPLLRDNPPRGCGLRSPPVNRGVRGSTPHTST